MIYRRHFFAPQVFFVDILWAFSAFCEGVFDILRIKTIETNRNMLLISPLNSVNIDEALIYLILAHDHLLSESVKVTQLDFIQFVISACHVEIR